VQTCTQRGVCGADQALRRDAPCLLILAFRRAAFSRPCAGGCPAHVGSSTVRFKALQRRQARQREREVQSREEQPTGRGVSRRVSRRDSRYGGRRQPERRADTAILDRDGK
jgi:hypothetical protein